MPKRSSSMRKVVPVSMSGPQAPLLRSGRSGEDIRLAGLVRCQGVVLMAKALDREFPKDRVEH